jgi:acyl dehydratase
LASDWYFEDFELGQMFESPGRTITEADVVNFAGLSGDYNALHTDAEYCKGTMFGEKIAHGLLGLSIASGLFTRTEASKGMHRTGIALLGINEWKFQRPILIGDTIHLEAVVQDKKQSKKPERGVITFLRKVVNQKGEVVQEGIMPMMVMTKISSIK